MKKRKTIGCILVRPEGIYEHRVLDGLLSQCEKYDYDLAVFCPMVVVSHYDKNYRRGDMNILNLIEYDRFDAFIVAALSFADSGNTEFLKGIYKKISEKCTKPLITLDYPFEGHETVYTDDTPAFREITKHILDVHNCKNIYFLTGIENYDISEKRVKGFTDVLKERGIPVEREKIFYGDFWYSSGEKLAERIISGELEIPDAVICASDHMAIGLVNSLVRGGIKVPEQVIVTGFDATQEALTNWPSVASYTPDVSGMAATAINRVRSIIEPDKPVYPVFNNNKTGFCEGLSCGCNENIAVYKKHLSESVYRSNRNFGDPNIKNNEDIGTLLESYMFENLTLAKSPLECLKRIYMNTYLLDPYNHFYLCLRPDWIDTEHTCIEGYPKKMRCAMHAISINSPEYDEKRISCRNDDSMLFDTSLMLPQLWEDKENAGVYYFAPIHFADNTLGYGVFNCEIKAKIKPTGVYRNWIRNVNNALEMIRVQNKLMGYSISDSMTKLNNRRGLEIKVNDLLSIAEENDRILAVVVDMDGLKRINDTYGHNEGDYAIMTIASVVRCITEGSEVCARAGGDEFYVIGVGKYSEELVEKRIKRFYDILSEQNGYSDKPYEITASVGYAIKDVAEIKDITQVIDVADSRMYSNKNERKKNRLY